MFDFDQIAGFDWDDGNARKSVNKHSVTPSEAEQVFTNKPLIVGEDAKHSVNESRLRALGSTNANRFLHVTFTLRQTGTLIRIISARDMNRKERAIYEGADGEKET